ncbi:hypothetical protein RHMOL_Rhmol09G0170000 [Rhododendron molle]|uniref:Uncharacterized protein n=1 Tax=Rhododendron molle TaxID=49168 RepID=A0ACC0MFE0_RHOML|nr:hypothetical protein RHMOL_Rhmol09G0170000 [Rhododendron molle]
MEHELKHEYERIIYNTLASCWSPVKVNLYIPKFGSGIDRFPDTDPWILHLSRKNIKELTLNYELHQTLFLPHCFYSCLDLTRLELCNVGLLPPRDFKGFRNLLELKLTRVAFMAYKFESPKRDHSATSSPLLEFLASLPKLTRLSANGSTYKHTNLEYFVAIFALKFLAADSLLQELELPPTTGGLKHLKLNNLDFADFDQISCAFCLIRNTPNLKELEIQPELELIQFLLASSPFLEKKVALDMAIELLRYYRASPRVDFKYLILRDI